MASWSQSKKGGREEGREREGGQGEGERREEEGKREG